jgi:hypothetical protein
MVVIYVGLEERVSHHEKNVKGERIGIASYGVFLWGDERPKLRWEWNRQGNGNKSNRWEG